MKGCFMVSNSSLDSLATSGVINFDADAFLKGTSPRFVGSPSNQYLPGEQPPSYGVTPGSKLNGEPERDAFVKHEKENTPPKWISMLTGFLVATLGVFGVVKAKSLFDKNKVDAETSTEKKGIFTQIKDKISSLLKSKDTKAAEEAKKAAEEAAAKEAKEAAKKAGFWAKHSKGLKIAGVGALSLLGLYGLYEIISGRKTQPAQEK